MSDALKETFLIQRNLLRWLDKRSKIPFKTSDEKSLAYLTCYDLTIEHHAAILTLFKCGLYGSMFALLRVQFEALIRGQFLHYAASDKHWRLYKKDKEMTKTFGEMITEVERKIDEQHQVLTKFKKQSYKFLCSFTHTGYQHLVRRHSNGAMGAVGYPEREIIQLLNTSGTLSLLAFAGLVEISGDKKLADRYLKRAKRYSLATKNPA